MIDESKQLENTTRDSQGEMSEEMQEETRSAENIAAQVDSEASSPTAGPEQTESLEAMGSEQSAASGPSAPEATVPEALLIELATKEAELEALKNQLKEVTNQSVRIAADFDNFRKRTHKEKEEMEQRIKCTTIKELLPVVDNFERARSQIKPQTDGEKNIHKSYQGVYKQLVDCLKGLGVSAMRCEEQEFDPNLHEAVMREQTDQYPEGTVIEELMRGYMLGDRVLRHAMVKVAAAPEPVEESVTIASESEESNESIEN
ncbi:MAG: nucleotide exchange factor GrpE [Hormoscilla sp.]